MLRAADRSLAHEPGLLERPLLGDIVDVGLGLDPVDLGRLEQVGREECLRLAPVAMPARLGEQPDPDVPCPGLGVRTVAHRVKADEADRLPVGDQFDDQLTVALVAKWSLRERLAIGRVRRPDRNR